MIGRRNFLKASVQMLADIPIVKMGAVVASMDPTQDLRMPSGVAAYNGNDLTAVAAWNAWSRRGEDAIDTVFFNQKSWLDFEAGIQYECDMFFGRTCIWSVPLTAAFGTIPDVRAGKYDSVFVKCAKAIEAAAPAGECILVRLGWEFNLLSQEQRAFDDQMPIPNPIPETWVLAFRRIVNVFRRESHRFRFVWCPNVGDAVENGLTVMECYPGDDVVDVVSLDVYFMDRYDDTRNAGLDTFAYRKDQGIGLDWLVRFAGSLGKPWSISEWGVDSVDATGYMDSFCRFLVRNRPLFHGYWNSDAGVACRISDGSLPAIGHIFQDFFAPPVIFTSDFEVPAHVRGTLSLRSNQDEDHKMIFTLAGGKDAAQFRIMGSKLSWNAIGPGRRDITIEATNGEGLSTRRNIRIEFIERK